METEFEEYCADMMRPNPLLDDLRFVPMHGAGTIDAVGRPIHVPPGLPYLGIGDIASKEPGSAARYNSGKPPMELVPVSLISLTVDGHLGIMLSYLGSWQKKDGDDDDNLSSAVEHLIRQYGVKFCWEECARVFDYGRQKYAEWNWTKGMKWSVPMACIVRHVLKIVDGREIDEESGRHHVGHIMCNLVMLQHYAYNYPEGDDRPDALKIKEK